MGTGRCLDKGEIFIYQPDDKSTQFVVRIDEETVWLNQIQMVELFSSSKQNHDRFLIIDKKLFITSEHQ